MASRKLVGGASVVQCMLPALSVLCPGRVSVGSYDACCSRGKLLHHCVAMVFSFIQDSNFSSIFTTAALLEAKGFSRRRVAGLFLQTWKAAPLKMVQIQFEG